MKIFVPILSLLMTMTGIHGWAMNKTIIDFETVDNVDNWTEMSDTVRRVGMSKAVITLQKTQVFQRAVFFSLLNPQINGAGFAGVRMVYHDNLEDYQFILINCRAQGNNKFYKITLRHKDQHDNTDYVYEQQFEVPLNTLEFTEIALPLNDFLPYFHGSVNPSPDIPKLDLTRISMIGVQTFGGVYSSFKQGGVSSLEIKSIDAVASFIETIL